MKGSVAVVLSCLLVLVILSGCASQATPPPRAALQTVTETPPPIVPAVRQPCTGTFDDARRHMIRGMAAIEMAKSATEINMAAEEFLCATEIDPQLANAWYNLARAQTQLGSYPAAIASYERYLQEAPNAEDVQKVRDEIIKLEFRQEIADKTLKRNGIWLGSDGTYFELKLNGDRFTLTSGNMVTPEDEIKSTYPIVGTMPIPSVPVEFQLVQQGNQLSGMYSRNAVTADKCTVPADSSTVTGEVDEVNKRIILRYQVMRYHAPTMMSILTDDFCGGVKTLGRKEKELAIYGSLSNPDLGMIGVGIYGMSNWFATGMTFPKSGWFGRLGLSQVDENSPAWQAGLRSGDEVLAIDGRPVKEMNAGEAVMALRGPIGSQVTLEVWRKDSPQTIVISMNRIAPPQS